MVLGLLDVAMSMLYLQSHLLEREPHMRMLPQCYQHNLGPQSWTAGNRIC